MVQLFCAVGSYVRSVIADFITRCTFIASIRRSGACTLDRNLVDPASSHMLVSKIKPCMSQYKSLNVETANGSLKQL